MMSLLATLAWSLLSHLLCPRTVLLAYTLIHLMYISPQAVTKAMDTAYDQRHQIKVWSAYMPSSSRLTHTHTHTYTHVNSLIRPPSRILGFAGRRGDWEWTSCVSSKKDSLWNPSFSQGLHEGPPPAWHATISASSSWRSWSKQPYPGPSSSIKTSK